MLPDISNLKSKKLFYLGAIIICISLIGCSETLSLSKEIDTERDLGFTQYSHDSVSGHDRIISRQSPKYIKFLAWVDKNKDGWEPSFTSYASPMFSISQEGFTMLCFKKSVVVKFKDGNEDHQQYAKFIKEGDLDFLKE